MNVLHSNTNAHSMKFAEGPDCKYNPAIVPGIIAVLDIVSIIFAYYISMEFFGPLSLEVNKTWFVIAFVIIVFLFLSLYSDLYKVDAIMRPMRRYNDIFTAIITLFLFMFAIIASLEVIYDYNVLSLIIFCFSCIVTISVARALTARALRILSARQIIGSTLVILGTGEQGRRFLHRLHEARPFFINIIGVFNPNDGLHAMPEATIFEGIPVLGGVTELLEYARARKIDDVVVALPWNADRAVMAVVEKLKELPINVYLSTDLVGFELSSAPVIGTFQQLPMFEVVRKPISGWGFILKSSEDIIIASLILIVISPLLIIIALMIKIDSDGPVFFMQRRLGFNNKEFLIYKFRSMYHKKNEDLHVKQAVRDDPRVTRVGRFIRSTSLDELPQLFNVLNGSMSLVGPRPHAISHNLEYSQQIRGYFTRHRVKPGITGWAQVNGYRGETDTLEKMERRIQYDIYYSENWSLVFDMKILIMTCFIIFYHKNVY